MSLRITGGNWRSRRLFRPESSATRPMPDKVKQSIFNILGHRFGCPGELPPLRVADVFAGSGSMGLEALSRGCASCDFYEADRIAIKALRANIEVLNAQKFTSIKTGDAWKAAARDAQQGAFELIFLDPPYKDTQSTQADGQVGRFLARIAESAVQAPKRVVPMVVLHHFEKVRFSQLDAPAPWAVWDERRLGSSGVTFFMDRADLETEPAPNEPDGT